MTKTDKLSAEIQVQIDQALDLMKSEERGSWVVIRDSPLTSGLEFSTEPFGVSASYDREGVIERYTKPVGKPPAPVVNPSVVNNVDNPITVISDVTGVRYEQVEFIYKKLNSNMTQSVSTLALCTFLYQIETQPAQRERAIAIQLSDYVSSFDKESPSIDAVKSECENLYWLIDTCLENVVQKETSIGTMRDPIIQNLEYSDISRIAWGEYGKKQGWIY